MRHARHLTALVVVVALGGLVTPATAQFFSPGPLARPHAALEGLEKCNKCHEEQKGLAARICLDCHTELAPRVAKGTGFHGRLAAEKRNACQACHPDHRGKDFEMVEWEGGRDKFDHRQTGWPLKGGHAKVACGDCHQRPFIADAAVRKLLDKYPKQVTYLGASARCAQCHFDEHRGQLGAECQKCHDENTWKKAPAFNHQASAFPLKGKHSDVACAKCHPTLTDEHAAPTAPPKWRAASFLAMKPIEFKTCESCHQDPHKGSLGPACASCHVETDWKVIKTAPGRDTTFHDKTRFPLRGGHVGVTCRSCHGPFPGQPARFKGLAFGACSDCHADAHLGQLAATPPAKVAACDRCHSVASFVPVRYELEDHAKTKFPLEGGHQVAACRDCHPLDSRLAAREPPAVLRKLAVEKRPQRFSFAVLHPSKSPSACLGCHEDVHRGQFADGTTRDTCSQCHSTTSFSDLSFNHDQDSRFPLTGKHAKAACAACHKPEKVGRGPVTPATIVRYKPLELTCRSCHTDYHQGQFSSQPRPPEDKASRLKGPSDCSDCHGTATFRETTFEHNNPRFTSYPLEGRHAQVACARCHPTVIVADGVKTVRYRALSRDCESCHVDFHHGEFRGFEP